MIHTIQYKLIQFIFHLFASARFLARGMPWQLPNPLKASHPQCLPRNLQQLLGLLRVLQAWTLMTRWHEVSQTQPGEWWKANVYPMFCWIDCPPLPSKCQSALRSKDIKDWALPFAVENIDTLTKGCIGLDMSQTLQTLDGNGSIILSLPQRVSVPNHEQSPKWILRPFDSIPN